MKKILVLSVLVVGAMLLSSCNFAGEWELSLDGKPVARAQVDDLREDVEETEEVEAEEPEAEETEAVEAEIDAEAEATDEVEDPNVEPKYWVLIDDGNGTVELDLAENPNVEKQETYTCPTDECYVSVSANVVIGMLAGTDTRVDWTAEAAHYDTTGYGHWSRNGTIAVRLDANEAVRFSIANQSDCEKYSESLWCQILP